MQEQIKMFLKYLFFLKIRLKIFPRAEMTRYWFCKMAGFPKLLGIFEFRKKHDIRNFAKRLNMRFQFIKPQNEFFKVVSMSRSFLRILGQFWNVVINSFKME